MLSGILTYGNHRCYTNHALDQFLKHLLDIGIQKVICIGGRSQAPELKGKNLRVISKDFRKTKVELQTLGKSYRELEAYIEDTRYIIKPLYQSQKGLSQAAIGNFVRRKWPTIYKQLNRPDLEGFTTITDNKLLYQLRVKSMRIQKGQNEDKVNIIRLERLTRATQEDIYTLINPERQILTIEWFKQWRESEIARIFKAINHAASLRNDINIVYNKVNRRALI